jgi:hypothetical protein
MLGSRPTGESCYGEIGGSPEEMNGAAFAYESRSESFEDAV